MSSFDRSAGWKTPDGRFIAIKDLNDYALVFAYTAFRNRVKCGKDTIVKIIEKQGSFTDSSYQSWLNRHEEIMVHLRGEMRKRKLVMHRVLADAEAKLKDDKGKTP